MDKALGDWGAGLQIAQFARDQKVSPRTVFRDLNALQAFGQHIEFRPDYRGEYVWTYADGTEPLFYKSVPRRVRELVASEWFQAELRRRAPATSVSKR